MKALTLTQPWATLMADGFKHNETRSWRTQYRGLLAIHAAIGFPRYAKTFAMEERACGRIPARIPRGAIVAVVRLLDVRPASDEALETTALERHLGDYSAGRWAWITELVLKLDEPIPCKGALGLWELPPEITQRLVEVLP